MSLHPSAGEVRCARKDNRKSFVLRAAITVTFWDF
jgi:hypothetical protein